MHLWCLRCNLLAIGAPQLTIEIRTINKHIVNGRQTQRIITAIPHSNFSPALNPSILSPPPPLPLAEVSFPVHGDQ